MEILCFSEQKVIQYEQYVRDLQAHHRAVANCQEAPNGISYQDLQQEVFNILIPFLFKNRKYHDKILELRRICRS